MIDEPGPALTAWLDDAKVRELIGAMDDEARSVEIFAFIGERRRHHQRELEAIHAALEAARSELDEMRAQRDETYREVEHLRGAVGQMQHELAVLRSERLAQGPIATGIKRAVVAGRAVTRSWR